MTTRLAYQAKIFIQTSESRQSLRQVSQHRRQCDALNLERSASARDGLSADFQCYALPVFRDDVDFANCSQSLAGIARQTIVHSLGEFRGYKLCDVHSIGFLP